MINENSFLESNLDIFLENPIPLNENSLIYIKYFLFYLKSQKNSSKASTYSNYFKSNLPNPNEIVNNLNNFDKITLFLEIIIDMNSLHFDLPKKDWLNALPKAISQFMTIFNQFHNNSIYISDPNAFFQCKFEDFSPFFLNKEDINLLQVLKKINKLAKNGFLTKEAHFFPMVFLGEKINKMVNFVQEIKLLKRSFRVLKKTIEPHFIKETLNIQFKSFFKHIFFNTVFHLTNNDPKICIENIWEFLLNIMILFENFDLSVSVFELFPLIIQKFYKQPNNEWSESFRSLEKFRGLVEKERENLNLIYFSKKNANVFISKKQQFKDLVNLYNSYNIY